MVCRGDLPRSPGTGQATFPTILFVRLGLYCPVRVCPAAYTNMGVAEGGKPPLYERGSRVPYFFRSE
jgi:hypothetical protein